MTLAQFQKRLALMTIAFIAMLMPSIALACGGFFCNRKPVDQQAERIIFVQEDETTVTSYVEIIYNGKPEGFAWVVPVPSVPQLDVWNGRAFDALDLSTEPRFIYQDDCFLAEADSGGGGGPPNANGGGVEVLDQRRVGPFDTATIRSDDPRELIEWLRVNDYRIVPSMEPFIELYTAENMKFLAMKLAPGEGIDSIEPIKMTYAAMGPAVPLRLTAVAAQLEMGVKIWILGDGRFGPTNVPDIEVADSELRWDYNTWTSNYQPLVARKVDAENGHGFVTEYAQPTGPLAMEIRDSFIPDRFREEAEVARDLLVELLESKPYITRLYTRVSPEEMDLDPMFGPVSGSDVSNIREIPEQEGDNDCGGGNAEAADACEFLACGAPGACAPAADGGQRQNVGCLCAEGSVARATAGPDGRPTVACGDARLNFTANTDAPQFQFSNPCELGDFCGDNGECVPMNGSISCRCETGYLAIPSFDPEGMMVPLCVAADMTAMPDAAELREPNLPYPGRTTPVVPPTMGDMTPGTMVANNDDGGCRAVPGQKAPLFWLIMLPGLFLLRLRKG